MEMNKVSAVPLVDYSTPQLRANETKVVMLPEGRSVSHSQLRINVTT